MDEPHWPKRMQEEPKRGMSLESLKLTRTGNLCSPGEGDRLPNWGCSWRRCNRYTRLNAVLTGLGFEPEGRVETIRFADPSARDLRVPRGSAIHRIVTRRPILYQ